MASRQNETREKVRADIIELLKEGKLSYQDIAQAVGCTISTVYVTARKTGCAAGQPPR